MHKWVKKKKVINRLVTRKTLPVSVPPEVKAGPEGTPLLRVGSQEPWWPAGTALTGRTFSILWASGQSPAGGPGGVRAQEACPKCL